MSKQIVSDTTKLIKDYKSGMSAAEIAQQLGTSTGVIMNSLRRAGVELRSASENAKLRLEKYGHPSVGRTHSEETRKKMRENHADFRGANHPQFKGKGQYAEDGAYLSRDGNGYLRRRMPSHPLADQKTGYIGEHIFQACLIWGVDKVVGNHVHHIDENKSNNSWDNLELKYLSEHIRFHNLEGREHYTKNKKRRD